MKILREMKNKENKKKSVWSDFGGDDDNDSKTTNGIENDELNTIKVLI